jgi:flavin reductase (DIM6/NTAB) family NADH-FMN oxidoreductase RutF
MAVADEAMEQIRKGAFLTVEADGQRNTMTIGWATIGFVWKKPVFMAAVRSSRYTFEIIEKAADFTVSIPNADMSRELAFCGSRSGRDVDKFRECNLSTIAASRVMSPIISAPGVHYECVIQYKQAMEPGHLSTDFQALYPKKDYHTLYFGEIVACYRTSQS